MPEKSVVLMSVADTMQLWHERSFHQNKRHVKSVMKQHDMMSQQLLISEKVACLLSNIGKLSEQGNNGRNHYVEEKAPNKDQ
ncbi:hypothetical protein AVEN_148921-1 [Araneus ventricosus]|uniref:GAG-pre-integrase domain-containing protein n=1 Tax=Araneus ventricosus TaxID=182803 RepID=A0A4Y2DKN2_ARAVE|nr:hypothetical protein AVEN_148921-1 [Araneus ventricosus]